MTTLWLPVLVIPQLIATLGAAWLIASLGVFLRDIAQGIGLLLMAWMYLTPIIYPLNALPDRYRLLILVNPMTHLVEAFRTPIYQGVLPSAHVMLTSTFAAIGALVIGWAIFEHYSDRVAYRV